MAIQKDATGCIINAAQLVADDVAAQLVLCPACGNMRFKSWPMGWDAHAAHRCGGASGATEEDRKEHFRDLFDHLFR